MAGGTLSVLAGTALGLGSLSAFLRDGQSEPLRLLPSLVMSLGGGYAVLFPAIGISPGGVRIHRNWRRHPRLARVLWMLSLAVAVTGLATCIAAGAANPTAPGLLVWLFMGLYLALAGWASALMGAAELRRQEVQDVPTVTAPGR
ncbi:hypothetical protein ACLH0K_12840 [Arthrobacter sp. MPF02]|uniref:hypothetical protein n=1 Tax=Arthrobacter sp. MPF02 TaxID=3388492 RepID=UPI0039852EC2